MSDLFWPGDERAGSLMNESALLAAMLRVEAAWLAALVDLTIAEPAAAHPLAGLVHDGDIAEIALGSEAGGNPVIPLVALLRARLDGTGEPAARWVHRGLTSQDVLDTALMLCTQDVLARLMSELRRQIGTLTELADSHRGTVMAGRTLTQHAVPITFGLKVAGWLRGTLDAADDLAAVSARLPSQLGGAAGSLAAAVELAALAGLDEPVERALDLAAQVSHDLGLQPSTPWHTARSPVTRVGDALVRCTGASGRIANDVLTSSRPEIAELAEPVASGRGSSSAMPQKVNPVLSVLIRRAALTAPAFGAQLHLAAAECLDERPDGSWHTEWSALQALCRRTVVSASQTTELLAGLRVEVERMRSTATAASSDLLAERAALAALFPASADPADDDLRSYLGASDHIIDSVLARSRQYLEEHP